MLRRRNVHLYLAIRLGPPDGPAGLPSTFLERLGNLGGDGHPVHWILPPGVFEPRDPSRRKVVETQLRARVLDHGDRLVATGHRGAIHPLLSLRHVRQDLAWAVRNPWRCGIADVLGRDPVAVYPPCPDWARPGVRPLYKELGLSVVIADWPTRERGPYVFHETEGDTVVVRALRAGEEAALAVRSALRAHTRTFFLVVDPQTLEDGHGLGVLEDLQTRYPLTYESLPDLPAADQRTGQTALADREPSCLPSSPLSRWSWSGASDRGASRRNDDARAVLEAYAATPREDRPLIPQGSLHPARRVPSSAMPGAVSLTGAVFDARFRDGVLCGVQRHGETTSPIAGCVTCVRHGPRAIHATVESATSFEDGEARGLRAVLALTGGVIVVDAWFPARQSLLALEILARYSADLDPGQLVPFGITVDLGPRTPEGQRSATLVCRSPAGQPTEHVLRSPRRGERTGVAAGSSFTVRSHGGELTLSFPPERGLSSRTLPWRLYTSGKTHTLELNPLGTYRPTETPSYAGVRERMTLLVSLEGEPPDPGQTVLRELSPDLIQRVE